MHDARLIPLEENNTCGNGVLMAFCILKVEVKCSVYHRDVLLLYLSLAMASRFRCIASAVFFGGGGGNNNYDINEILIPHIPCPYFGMKRSSGG